MKALPVFPATPSLHRRFEAQVDRTPDAVALTLDARQVSYRELDARANRLAQRLRRAGVGPDTLVGLSTERSIDLVVGVLGILKAGGAYLPLDPAYPGDRLAFMLEDARVRVLVTHDEVQAPPQVSGIASGIEIVRVGETDGEPDGRVDDAVGPEHLAYVIYTSGSTGKPKGVQVTHGNVVRLMEATDTWFGFGPDDVWTLFHSYAFDFSVWELWGPLLYGGRLVVVPYATSRSPEAFHDLLLKESVTVLNQTPSAFRQLVHAIETKAASGVPVGPLALRTIVFGGEALELQGLRPWFERFGDQRPRLINMYGITETTVHVTYRPIGWDDVRQGLGSVIGVPIPDLGVHLLDEALTPVAEGTPGEIFVEGAGLARGYLGRPELTAQRFLTAAPDAGGPRRLYRTGDLARRLPTGELEYLGRIDQQVKIRGFRIELGEIESVIAQHPAVREVVVLAREDTPGDKRLVAYLTASATDGLVEGLRERAREKLPLYMVPAAFVILPRLPLTENGKVDRRALPPPDTRRPDLPTEYLEPDGETEQTLAEIWRRLLGIDRVGANDSFFDLGGSSMLAVQLLTEVRKVTGRALPVVALFRHPTVRGLAVELGGGGEGIALGDVARRAERQHAGNRDAIAIIGMAGRFPGAPNVEAFWEMLCAGREGVRFFADGELDPRVDASDPRYVKARGVIADADKFDAPFFGEPPAFAELIDPQQRLLLETSWAALEDAGVVPGKHGATIGVFAGTGHNTYLLKNVVRRTDRIDALGDLQMIIANDKDFVATRVAHKLNLAGPALSVHTACSTSLVAVCLARDSLLDHACDIALAGAASITVPQMAGHVYAEGSMQSADGHTRTFDAQASGTVFSDGAGVVVLKRLSDARRDGDRIYAVIRGGALNNDGAAKASYTAPSVAGQAQVIALAHAVAGVDPSTIGYVEAHGTATPLGDPVEVAALTQAFRARTQARGFCAIGSVKSNVGHMTAASGVGGLIKTALALHHGKLPPSLHFDAPNPSIDFGDSPFRVQTRLEDWRATGGVPRRAGVSSFGVGGTNAHVVLEEAPPAGDVGASRAPHLLLLSGKTRAAVDRAAAALAEWLRAAPAGIDLADVAYTLQTRRTHFAHRRYVVAATRDQAIAALAAPAEAAAARTVERSGIAPAFVFPGQGTQYVGMGRGLHATEPVFRAAFDRVAEIVRPRIGRDLRDVCFGGGGSPEPDAASALRQTVFTQPALFAVEYALGTLWRSWGVEPQALVGHSVGEFVAAALADVFTLEDAAMLVAERGRLMQALPPGSMLSVRAPAAAVEPRLDGGLALAASNGPELCVVSGPDTEVRAFEARLASEGIATRALHTSHAFHSAMMDPVVAPFRALVESVRRAPPRIPIISTATGAPLSPEEAIDAGYWARHLRVPVRFMESLRRLAGDAGRIFLEVGPRATSTTLARQVIKAEGRKAEGPAAARPAGAREALAIGSLKDDAAGESESVAQALGQLWLAGAGVDWEAFQSIGRRRLVSLPSYPFARDRHWLDPELPGQAGMPLRAPAPSNGHPVPGPAVPNGQPAAAVNGEGLPADVLEQTLMAQLTLMNEQLKLLSD